MKLKLLIATGISITHIGYTQEKNTILEEKIDKLDIEIVFNQYLQNGEHSAVTGGLGTEKLQVYAPSLNIKRLKKSHTFQLNTGVDIITSASTDNIDYVVSSASKHDNRAYANMTYGNSKLIKGLDLYAGMGLSVESDYTSFSGKLGITKESKDKMQSFNAQVQYYNDDLRWGLFDVDIKKRNNLIYPSELRYKEWYDTYKRYSYNLKLAYNQVINKRNIIGFYPELTYQNGLLSTPFHRIYFKDQTVGVEQLPNQRWKGALGVKWNYFLKGNYIFKSTANLYKDNFGITAFSIEEEVAIKLKSSITITPNFRYYTQSAADFFAPKFEQDSKNKHYTSDYDYSKLNSISIGTKVKYSPFKYWTKNYIFNSVQLSYNYYLRSDGLNAHIVGLIFQSQKNYK